MSEKPRIAIVGAGLIGQRHAKLVAEHMTLDAIVDPSDSAKAFADSFGVRYFARLASYLDAERPDGRDPVASRTRALCVAAGQPYKHCLKCQNRARTGT